MDKNLLQRSFNLVNILNKILKEKRLITSNEKILLSISGGQDSSCLLLVFFQLKRQWNITLTIVYCNHLWQKDSFYTMRNIFNLIFLYKIRAYFTINLIHLNTNSEQKARLWRYVCYERINYYYTIKITTTGHTASDKLETFLFNLFRGAGTQGVNSLNWQRDICFNKTKLFFYTLNYENYKFFSCQKIFIGFRKHKLENSVQQCEFYFNKVNKLVFHLNKSLNLIKLKHEQNPLKTLFLYKYINIYKKQKKNYKINSFIFFCNFQDLDNIQVKNIKKFSKWQKNIIIITKIEKQKPFTYRRIFLSMTKKLINLVYYLRKFFFNNYIFYKKIIILNQEINYSNLHFIFINPKIFYKNNKLNKHFYINYNLFSNRKKFLFKKLLKFNKTFYKLKFIKIFFFKSTFKKTSLIRPFLYFNRTDINKLCNFWKIPLYPDKSNQYLNYSRNRIRKQILPTIRFFFNPQIDNILHQFSEMSDLEQKFLNFITSQLNIEAEIKTTKEVLFRTSILNFIPLSLQRRLIYQYLGSFLSKKIKFYHVDTILELISKNNQKNLKRKVSGNNIGKLQTHERLFITKPHLKNFFLNNLSFTEKYLIFPQLGMIKISSSFITVYK